MSYCRWSSDSYRSDLYVYDDIDGTTRINVAARRHDLVDSQVLAAAPKIDAPMAEWVEFTRHYRAFMDALASAPLKPIGLSRDGAMFRCATHAEAADIVQSLIDEGYRAPAGVADDLRAASEDDETTAASKSHDWDEALRPRDKEHQ